VYAEHPEWRACDVFGTQSENFIDFTNPEAAAWARRELERIIAEYKIDLLRVDYNVLAKDYFAMSDTGNGTKECISFRHFQAVYEMYESLKKQFPNVIFENCASGGARTDLGCMKAFNHTWVSDCQKAPRSVMITNGMTMALPPERVDRLVAGMGCHAFGSFDLHVRNTMLGHMTLNVIAPAVLTPNPVQMEFLQHSVALYKDFIRPMLPTSKIFHHTPESASNADGTLSILEIASPDGTRGAMTVITLANAEADRLICPRGIDIGRTYEVTLDNSRTSFTVSGYELSTQGVRVSIPSALASELVLYRAI
jgi:alpha-galactosidase